MYEAIVIHVCSIKWNSESYHIFPRSLLRMVPAKILRENTKAFVVIQK